MRLFPLFFSFIAIVTVACAKVALTPLDPLVQGARVDFQLEGAPTAENNFDPDQIAIDVTFTSPSGKTRTLPAFWYQSFGRRLVNGSESLQPEGDPHWRVRYLAAEGGTHAISVRIRASNTPEDVSSHTFDFAIGHAPSFVRVAENKRDLATDDGRHLKLIGANYCWPDSRGTFAYDQMFNLLHRSGGNFARLWMSPWWAGIEHKPGTLNRYPLDEAWRMDHIFAQAEGNKIYLMLCFDHHGMYQVANKNWGGSNNFWPTNPYSVAQGGPCENPNDFFTNKTAREIYQKRLRYLIGRFGYSPWLLSWQFFNEIDNTFIQGVNGNDVVAWHQLMARWLRANDPYQHLITSSLTGGSDRPEFWDLKEMDMAMYHSYIDPAPARTLAFLAADQTKRYNKPTMIGEFGVEARAWNIAVDPHLRGFRQQLWGSAMGGSVGSGMSWWWDEMEHDGAYPLLQQFSRLMDRAGWQTGDWRPVVPSPAATLAPTEIVPATPEAEIITIAVALNTGRRLPLRGSAALPTVLAGERASESVSAFLYGTRNPELPQSIALRVHAADKARLTFRVNAVASDNQLVVRSNGLELFRTGFVDVDGQAQLNGEINKPFTIDLPSGLQTIELANVGNDWTGLADLKVERALATRFVEGWEYSPEAFALRDDQRAAVYVVSPHTVYPAGALRYRAPVVSNKELQLADWPNGRYRVTWFDPETGAEKGTAQANASQGRLPLLLPDFDDDLVAIVAPVE